MTDYCRSLGPSLLAQGYLVVPIRRGEKHPAISGWQKARLDPDALSRRMVAEQVDEITVAKELF